MVRGRVHKFDGRTISLRRRRKVKHYSQYFFIVGAILGIVFLGVLINEFVSFDFATKIFEKPHLIEIEDQCSLIMGNLVHQVRDETDCSLRCHNECNIEESKFVRSNFTMRSPASCNICECYCK